MATVLRYMAGYWLVISSLILVLYDWQVRHRFPKGIERLQLVVLIPGLLFLIASFVVSYRRKRREADALEKMFPNGLPVTPSNHSHAMAEEVHSTSNAKPSSRSPGHIAPTTNLAMEQASDLLVSSVMKNGDALEEAVLLLAKKDVSAADGLSRIVQASKTVRKLSSDESS